MNSDAATVTIVDPKPAVVVVNEDAFTTWVAENYPTEVGVVSTADRFLTALDHAVDDWSQSAKQKAADRSSQLMAEGGGKSETTAAWASGERGKTPLNSVGIMASVIDHLGDTPVSYRITASVVRTTYEVIGIWVRASANSP